MERWLDVPDYEGIYQVSDHGRIKSLARCRPNPLGGRGQICQDERIMRPIANMNGYEFIFLKREGNRVKFYMHRLVAIVFIPNPHDKPIVNHKDRDRQNNHVLNLEWCTGSENQLHWREDERQKNSDEIVINDEDLPF